MCDEDYQPVPPLSTRIVSVRYVYRGRGEPLPYPLEDDETAPPSGEAGHAN
jgi:hypothetical protein